MKQLVKKVIVTSTLLLSTSIFAQNYTIGTGNQSGTYYPLGGILAKVWSENIDDFDMRAEVTAASVENTIKVANDQQLTGLAMGNVVLQAHQGVAPFPKKMDVSVLFALYPNAVQFVVPADSPITSVSQLKGKKVSVGAPGSGTRVSALNVLKSLGVEESDINAQPLNFSATTSALANGQIDAGAIVGSLGIGAITELALTRKVRVLSFTDEEMQKVIADHPAYQSIEAPEGTYNNVPAFNTLAVWNVLVVNNDMSEDMAYELTKVAFDNIDKIRQVVNVTKFTTLENMNKLSGVPLHPGSQKYLDEHLNK